MNYKYLGEAIALLGIAYSIMRWIGRNASEADVRGVMPVELDRRGIDDPAGVPATRGRMVPPDAHSLSAAAAAFGITPDALARMDVRELSLLVEGYTAMQARQSKEAPADGE